MSAQIPAKMKALWYEKPEHYDFREVDVPQIKDDQVLVKGKEPAFLCQVLTDTQSMPLEFAVPTSISMRVNSSQSSP